MIDIQFIPKRKKGVMDIVVNGKIEHDVHYTAEDKAHRKSIEFLNQDIVNDLCSRTFSEIGAFIPGYSYKKWMGNSELEFEIYIICKELIHSSSSYFIIYPKMEISKWKKLYSIRELVDSIQVEYDKEKFKKLQYRHYDENEGSSFDFFYEADMNARIDKKLDKILDFIDKILGRAIDALICKIDYGSLVTFFYFPITVRAACQQYLLYFSQFLFDLGIVVKAQINEEGERTFLKITPTNKSEALESIRHALQIYLTAPDDINIDSPYFFNSDIAVLQWRENIRSLKYQLVLAQSVIQMKDAAIESLKLSNYQYKQLVNDSQSSKNLLEEETLIKGVLSVTKVEGKGFVINLPEILRKLKRRFKKIE